MMKKFTWGHGVVVALGSFMIFILSLIFIYGDGRQTSELITDNYYEEELAFQDIIDAKNNADQLSPKPVYNQNEHQITVTFPENINNENSTFIIDMYRPDDSRYDFKKEAKLDAYNRIVIPSKILVKGSYILKMKWSTDNKNYQIDYNLNW